MIAIAEVKATMPEADPHHGHAHDGAHGGEHGHSHGHGMGAAGLRPAFRDPEAPTH
jgi:hypothetical protein